MKISVVIPTYNRLGYLKQALESLEQQDYPVWEIIVVDDGSIDGTKEYILANKANVTLLTQCNFGPGAARNKGIDAATGDYIAFLDSDDLWFPWTAGVYRKALKESRAGIIFGNPKRFHELCELD
jgi:glycosyltransferase involved in cell wall biosynthesis